MKNEGFDFVETYVDKTTFLFNRSKFFVDLKKRKKRTLIVLNIDSFFDLNYKYGEYLGNIILKNVAFVLKKNFPDEKIYRLHGDEFAVIIEDDTKITSIKNKIKFLIKELTLKRIIKKDCIHDIFINITIGIAISDKKVFSKASLAKKIAKLEFKNYLFYSAELNKLKEIEEQLSVESYQLKDAFEKGSIVPFYQPISLNSKDKITKFEALARVIYNSKIIMPDNFIAAAKKAKIYNQITKAMISKVFEDFKSISNRQVSINISNEDIFSEEIVSFIIDGLNKIDYPQNIVFEITESGKIPDYNELKKFTTKVKEYGCKISIDDFGTEYSNISHIANIDADYLKIDGQFIKNIDKSKKNFKLVKSMVTMSKDFEVEIIAEYVENTEILNIIKEIGVDYSQGYYFGKPMSFEKIIEEGLLND